MLLDNSGTVRDGTLTARLQILSGTGAVGAGVVFGFQSAQAYYGVRIGPRDVVLYQARGTERALIARAPVAAPVKKWHTLAVDLSQGTAKVSLNGIALPALARPLEGYKGGRAGLHTQGDTLALFDQWQVAVR
jgi:hypothetical protein